VRAGHEWWAWRKWQVERGVHRLYLAHSHLPAGSSPGGASQTCCVAPSLRGNWRGDCKEHITQHAAGQRQQQGVSIVKAQARPKPAATAPHSLWARHSPDDQWGFRACLLSLKALWLQELKAKCLAEWLLDCDRPEPSSQAFCRFATGLLTTSNQPSPLSGSAGRSKFYSLSS
jgi:hypothetical protein